MFKIKVEDRKESFFFAIALGCVLLLAVGATVIFWTDHGTYDFSEGEESMSGTTTTTPDKKQTVVEEDGTERTSLQTPSSVSLHTETTTDDRSLWFFGTLICALLILFGLTFRYYSHREVKEAEKRWEMATRNFITRMEVERANSEDGKNDADTIWSRILSGQGVEASDIRRISVNARSRDRSGEL
jgi:hypothetical protein